MEQTPSYRTPHGCGASHPVVWIGGGAASRHRVNLFLCEVGMRHQGPPTEVEVAPLPASIDASLRHRHYVTIYSHAQATSSGRVPRGSLSSERSFSYVHVKVVPGHRSGLTGVPIHSFLPRLAQPLAATKKPTDQWLSGNPSSLQ